MLEPTELLEMLLEPILPRLQKVARQMEGQAVVFWWDGDGLQAGLMPAPGTEPVPTEAASTVPDSGSESSPPARERPAATRARGGAPQ